MFDRAFPISKKKAAYPSRAGCLPILIDKDNKKNNIILLYAAC